MIEIRKGRTEDMQAIIKVANDSFAPIREKGFDFRNIMPKFYNGKNTAKHHAVLSEDGKIVSVVGNLPSEMRVGERSYPFSIVGTVSTLPECRKRGYMTQLMKFVDGENAENGTVFGVLTGSRDRYNHFGYEKCATLYSFGFGSYFSEHHSCAAEVSVTPYSAEYLDEIYAVFLASTPHIMRTKDEFIDCLHTGATTVKVVLHKGKPMGYYVLSTRKDCIMELKLNDLSLLPDTVAVIMKTEGLKYADFRVNPLDFSLVSAMDGIAEEKCLADYLHIKVYDMAKFLELIISLDLPLICSREITEIYSIGGKCYSIEVSGEGVCVKNIGGNSSLKNYSEQEFLRKSIGLSGNELCKNSAIFPVQFGISEPDLF